MNATETRRTNLIKSLRFGTEIEFTGISRDLAAKAVSSVLPGSTVRYVGGTYEKWAVVATDGRTWTVMSDGSVTGSRYNQGGEMVTPILTWQDMDTLQEVTRALRRAGARVDSSCGQHVHVDGAGFVAQPAKLRNLMAFAYRWEAPITGMAEILPDRKADFCKDISLTVYDRFRTSTLRNLDDAKRAWYGVVPSYFNHYDATRYHWLNVHALFDKGTIEIRAFNATLHAGKVKANVIFSLAIIAKALDSRSISWAGAPSTHTMGHLPNGGYGSTLVDAAGRRLVSKYNARELLVFNLLLVGDEFANTRAHLGRALGLRARTVDTSDVAPAASTTATAAYIIPVVEGSSNVEALA